MRFIWFWTFWHWSKEGFRCGTLLRDPLHGIGSNWDEWFHHESSLNDRLAIADISLVESEQRRFIIWLRRQWARQVDWGGNRQAPRFILGQLARLPPFEDWTAFDEYRKGYGQHGVSSVVLAEESMGQPSDVRPLEAIVLPSGGEAEPSVAAEGFQAEAAELEAPRQAALSLLRGNGLLGFLALWIAVGRRPYPKWLKRALGLGWAAQAGLILYLLLGPDPQERLFLYSAVLAALWSGLALTGLSLAAKQCWSAWRQGKIWGARLEQGQLRLRMDSGLTLQGGSAGLPFCLNAMTALYRAFGPGRSWLWRRFFQRLRSQSDGWAASGVITGAASLKPVVLEPKLRACLQHPRIRHIITPGQGGASRGAVRRLVAEQSPAGSQQGPKALRLGFAAEQPDLQVHPCRHAAQSLMAIGGFTSRWQMAVNLLAGLLTLVMLAAAPDLRAILLPPQAPAPVAPASSSPYYLWVSLDTRHPDYFQAVFESNFWSNRRAEVSRYSGANASVRAEIPLQRLARPAAFDEEDGVIWIERRRRFLNREFSPGERVGHYAMSYLMSLGHK